MHPMTKENLNPPFLVKETVLIWGNYGYITIPQILSVTHWFIIALFVIGVLALFRWFKKKGLSLSIRSRGVLSGSVQISLVVLRRQPQRWMAFS